MMTTLLGAVARFPFSSNNSILRLLSLRRRKGYGIPTAKAPQLLSQAILLILPMGLELVWNQVLQSVVLEHASRLAYTTISSLIYATIYAWPT